MNNQTNTTTKEEIKTLVELVQRATDINDHTGARQLIARHFRLNGYMTKFDCIKTIHEIDGHLETEIRLLRDKYTFELLNYLHKTQDKDTYRLLTRSL